ncbi:S1 RNA-binding domain-containing protein [Herbidospora galbida]|uniref:S1 RNA-binding domain-containing protein n=1 Tax=Herbidospora galbida TaxID=2575442 RepID=UPI00148591A3|nr:S1 RNA-binding domain-containing protein [Herbidospora galbida]
MRDKVRGFQNGQVRRGVVSAITRFGIFVDIGGVDGMVSAANASWLRFERFEDLVRVGQDVLVMVLDVDPVRLRVSVSLKAVQEDPLIEFARTRLGEVFTGPVTLITPPGVFVELAPGVEGLVPTGEFPDGSRPAEGQDLRVRLCDIDLENRRLTLGLA